MKKNLKKMISAMFAANLLLFTFGAAGSIFAGQPSCMKTKECKPIPITITKPQTPQKPHEENETNNTTNNNTNTNSSTNSNNNSNENKNTNNVNSQTSSGSNSESNSNASATANANATATATTTPAQVVVQPVQMQPTTTAATTGVKAETNEHTAQAATVASENQLPETGGFDPIVASLGGSLALIGGIWLKSRKMA
jgi:LPXTG-motif cell wall-anchored protein